MRMKKFLAISMSLLFLIVLSACGANNDGTASKETNKDKKEDSSETRTYKSAKGDIELLANPERVVVAVQDYVGDVLAVGVTPIGATGTVFDIPYYEDKLKGVENIGDGTAISVEKVTTLEPDVILTYADDTYEQLSKIAPTVLLPYGEHNYRERLLEFGKILNKEKEAEEFLATFDERVKEKKQELAGKVEKDEKVVILELTEKEIYLYGKSFGRAGEIIYNELGLTAPEKVEEVAFSEGWAAISMETIPEYLNEADHIFLGVREVEGNAEGAEETKSGVTSLDIWKNLPAVKAGNVYEYEVDTMYYQDPIALDNQLDFVVESLLSNK